ncbi:BTAD domain-containing putative transcriptional regulator [Pseudonocardia charpentierae]|uniref:BTAD domain-containing putative transcriptional regulator n=1 Tax=Pseudonocardia charpentierae TaxID=3075545 RepID=A0ABU2NHI3_9PSEU|nr:BTAD domain-containing putative transcriptional regulator [Pseudonocardia sp. DSM 45834]MDT0353422.1 BTAD domain-containing putative transcriptional regulator [Pseudonocardia sp. DSM 45834]
MAHVAGVAAVPPHFRDLGPLLVEVDGVERTPGGPRPAAALALLLINANRRVSSDTLGNALWADGRPRAASTLESHLWRLRQVLEPDRSQGRAPAVLVTESGGYRLVVSADQVDSVRFEQLVEDAATQLRQGRPDRALDRCDEARSLWRGRPFDGVADRDWAVSTVARLEEGRTQLVERRIDALMQVGEPERALLELESELREHPLREHLWAQRMLACQLCGRTDAALEAFHDARRLLIDELGLEPGEELRAVHARILKGDPGLHAIVRRRDPAPPADDDLLHLPVPAGDLVGRDEELRRVAALVRQIPLVTLAGPAGVGKTRLAVELARRTSGSFPDGVWFVDLTPAQDAEQVADAVASALGVPSAPTGSRDDALRVFTRDRRMLLLLDNCEHVLDETAGLVATVRRTGRELTVLATSREPLDVADEHVVVVDPLALTDAGPGGQAASVALFVDRLNGRARYADGEPERDDLIRRICRAVDGIPLAIELAAARARSFSLREVADQVELDPSSLSRVGRGRAGPRSTVRATVEWSHRLLGPDEQRLHRALSVLPGPFTLSAAAAVTGIDTATTADLLADLVHRSLVAPLGSSRPGRPSRFAQLAIIRGHGARALADAGEAAACRARRDAWVEHLITEDPPRLGSVAETTWFAAIDDDLAALRATLRHTLVDERSPAGGRIMSAAPLMYWYTRGATLEGRRWTELAADVAPPGLSAAMLSLSLSAFWGVAGRGDQAEPHGTAGLHELPPNLTVDDDLLVGDQLVVLAGCLWLSGCRALYSQVLDRIEAISTRTGDADLRLLHRVRSGPLELTRRPAADVLADAAAAHTEAQERHNHYASWFATIVTQMAALTAGDPAAALHWSDRALAELHHTAQSRAPFHLEFRANALTLLGRNDEALQTYAAARAHNLHLGVPWPSQDATAHLLERARAALPPHRAEAAWNDGAGLTVDDLAGQAG